MCGWLRGKAPESQGNQVLIARNWSYILDPKPGELSMSRVKFDESQMEARTGRSYNVFG